MVQYKINYFDEKEVGYFGDFYGVIKYAESFARNLALAYRGEIKIYGPYGDLVASQRWYEDKDGGFWPELWTVNC